MMQKAPVLLINLSGYYNKPINHKFYFCDSYIHDLLYKVAGRKYLNDEE